MKFQKVIFTALCIAGILSTSTSFAATSFQSCLNERPVKFSGTVVDAAIATPDLSTLVTAVTAAGLVETLANAENITVFAPTNAAFDNIPPMLLNEILADTDVLTAILTYHVASGNKDPRVRLTATKIQTLAGQSVFFHRKDREQRVNDAIVSCTPVRTDNGVVYFIDSVLMPQL